MISSEDKENTKKNTVSVSVSGFPMKHWIEWNKDCIDNYGDCRWLKAVNDHQASQRFFILDSLFRELAMLRMEIEAMKGNPKQEETGVKTLGGGVRNVKELERDEKTE